MMKLLALAALVMTVVFVSGCTGIGPESLAFANPLVKQFMSEYPNATITANYFSAEKSAQILENISAECGNPYMEAKNFYRVNIDDPGSGLKVIAWIDWDGKKIECAVKYGGGQEKTVSKPGEETKSCNAHYTKKCYSGNVYWVDSCSNKEEKKEYCQNGCAEGKCILSETSGEDNKTGCKSHSKYECYGDHVYWFDSCGHVQEKKEYCNNKCENGFCRNATISSECNDSDGGRNYLEKGTATKSSQSLTDHCNDDGTLTEKYCGENGEISAESVSCPEGKRCDGGRCVAASNESQTG